MTVSDVGWGGNKERKEAKKKEDREKKIPDLDVLQSLGHVLGELPPGRDAQAALQAGRVRLLASKDLISGRRPLLV